MPHNLTTATAMGLISSLFDIASCRDVPFGIPQYVQCTHHGLTFACICVPFLFADSPKVLFHSSVMHGFPTFVKIVCILYGDYIDFRGTSNIAV